MYLLDLKTHVNPIDRSKNDVSIRYQIADPNLPNPHKEWLTASRTHLFQNASDDKLTFSLIGRDLCSSVVTSFVRDILVELQVLPNHYPRMMLAEKEGTSCRYCDGVICRDDLIAGHYGVLWGHRGCLLRAYAWGHLIQSPNNFRRRPKEIEHLFDRKYLGLGNKVVYLDHEASPLPVVSSLPVLHDEFTLNISPAQDSRDITRMTQYLMDRCYEQYAIPREALGAFMSNQQVALSLEQKAQIFETLKDMAKEEGVTITTAQQDSPNLKERPTLAGRFRSSEPNKQHYNVGPARALDTYLFGDVVSEAMMRPPRMVECRNTCRTFKPVMFLGVTMPKSMRPKRNRHEQTGDLLQEQWDLLIQQKLNEYKMDKRELEKCPLHGHTLEVKSLFVPNTMGYVREDNRRWTKELWWYCPEDKKSGE